MLPITILFLLLPYGTAWWDAGHMLTAAVARERLSPQAKLRADDLVAASLSTQEGQTVPSDTFVGVAHWADDVKREAGFITSPDGVYVALDSHHISAQHFKDLPFSDGHKCPASITDNENNIVLAVRPLLEALSSCLAVFPTVSSLFSSPDMQPLCETQVKQLRDATERKSDLVFLCIG